MRKWWKVAALVAAVLVLVPILICAVRQPSNNRDWALDQSVLPRVSIHGDQARIRNVRNFRYQSEDRYQASWYDATYDLRELESVWFLVEPFGGWDGAAHTFVSFGFGEGRYLSISVEIRKEKGERFSALRGLLDEYELMYVLGDERDLVLLRSNFRRDDVFLYPVRASHEQMRRMFVEMIGRAEGLARRPEFYNTLTNTCTSNLVRHVNAIVPGRIPLRPGVVFPGYSDRLAWELGLIDTTLTFAQARRHFRINERARRFATDPAFSQRIRVADGTH
jgi:hypothetical protein